MSTKQDGQRPLAYFAPSQFGKGAILKDENVFFRKKNTLSSSYFYFFQRSKFSDFFVKKLHS